MSQKKGHIGYCMGNRDVVKACKDKSQEDLRDRLHKIGGGQVQSISGMQSYQEKIQRELRFEDDIELNLVPQTFLLSPWIHSRPFSPLKPTSSSSTTSIFSPSRNAWALSTSATVSHNNLHCLHVQCHLPTFVLWSSAARNDSIKLEEHFNNQRFSPINCYSVQNVAQGSYQHPWHTRIGNLNIFDARDFGCTAALDAEHYLQEIGALEGPVSSFSCPCYPYLFYFPRIMEVNPSPVTPPAETQPSVQISVEHPNLATSILYGVSSLPVSNNPAMIRQKYSSIIRHSSLSKTYVAPKYKPTSDIPKGRSWILCEACLVVCVMLWLIDQKCKNNTYHMQRLQVRFSFSWMKKTLLTDQEPLIGVTAFHESFSRIKTGTPCFRLACKLKLLKGDKEMEQRGRYQMEMKILGALVFNLIGEWVKEWLERAVEEEEARDSCLELSRSRFINRNNFKQRCSLGFREPELFENIVAGWRPRAINTAKKIVNEETVVYLYFLVYTKYRTEVACQFLDKSQRDVWKKKFLKIKKTLGADLPDGLSCAVSSINMDKLPKRLRGKGTEVDVLFSTDAKEGNIDSVEQAWLPLQLKYWNQGDRKYIKLKRTSFDTSRRGTAIADRGVERSVVVVGDTSSIAPRPISLGGMSGGYELQDKPIEVPSGLLNSSSVEGEAGKLKFEIAKWKSSEEVIVEEGEAGKLKFEIAKWKSSEEVIVEVH
uniref:Uncharacterized protein n=1 Tax=Solanum lycopersicum TaxID=4081 RepID=A0A3Q7EQQ3_SOLLC